MGAPFVSSATGISPVDSISSRVAGRRRTWARIQIWPLVMLSLFGATPAWASGTASAYAVQVGVTLTGQPAVNAGPLAASNSAGPTTATVASVTLPGVLLTGVLNTSATGSASGDAATASAANVIVPFLVSAVGNPVVFQTIQASCSATPGSITGTTTLTNATLGSLGTLAANPAPNTTIQIAVASVTVATLTLNEQTLRPLGPQSDGQCMAPPSPRRSSRLTWHR